MPVKKYVFACLPVVAGMFLNTYLTSFYLFIYYILIIIAYVVLGVWYEPGLFGHRKRVKKAKLLITSKTYLFPDSMTKVKNWLDVEGFKLKSNEGGFLYLKSKTTEIKYYPTLHERLNIIPIKYNSKEFLIYKEDEELKIRLEQYLYYISQEEEKLRKQAGRFSTLNKEAMYPTYDMEEKMKRFWRISIKMQGYIFLFILLLDISDDSIFSYNIVRLFMFLIYMVIMEV